MSEGGVATNNGVDAESSVLLYVEDLPVGFTQELGSFVLSQDEMIEFASRWDPAPIHVDPEVAARSFFGGIIATGLHTLSAVTRLQYDGVISKVAMIGGREVSFRMPRPVRPDERIEVRTSVTEQRDSRRDDHGIVVFTGEAINPAAAVVMIATFEVVVQRRRPLASTDGS